MVYEFRCRACGRRFDVVATLAEKEAGLAPVCPACGSADVGRVFSRVLFLRSTGKGQSGSESQWDKADGEQWGSGRGEQPGDFEDGGWDDAGGDELDGDHPGFDAMGDEDVGEPDGEEFAGDLEDDES